MIQIWEEKLGVHCYVLHYIWSGIKLFEGIFLLNKMNIVNLRKGNTKNISNRYKN